NGSANDQGGAAERTIVNAATPSLVTAPNAASIALGGTATDTATLSGGYFPIGSITFTLTNTDTSTIVFTNTVTGVSGNNSYTSSGYTVTVAGHYQWTATYNGDGNNNTAIDNNPLQERFTVPASPTGIITTASAAITLGTTAPTLTDSAVLAGGFNPTGTITFTLIGPGGFSYHQTDEVSGNRTYNACETLPTTGTTL